MKIGLRELVFILLLAAIPVTAWYFVFRPRTARSQEIQREVQIKRRRLEALNRATGTIGDLQGEIESLQKAITFFRSRLPNAKDIDKVLQEVWRLAESSRLVTKSIRTADTSGQYASLVSDDPYGEQPIIMELTGDFMGLYTFLQAMENQPRITRIHRLSIETLDSPGDGVVKAELVLSIFFERSGSQ